MKTLRKAFLGFSLVFLASALFSQTQPTPAEARDWFLSKVGGIVVTGRCSSRGDLAFTTGTVSWEDPCTLKFTETNMESCEPRLTMRETKTVSLGSLDPQKVDFKCGRGGCILNFSTTNGEKKIKALEGTTMIGKPGVDWRQFSPPSTTPSYISETRVSLRAEENIGQRAKNALVFLIQSCGGDVSKREAF